jgi:hypothetical protein
MPIFQTTTWQEPMLRKGIMYHITVLCVLVFLSLAVSYSHCHTPSISPKYFVDVWWLWWLSCLYLSLIHTHCQSFVTHYLSHAASHTTTPLSLSPPSYRSLILTSVYTLALVDCCLLFFILFFRLSLLLIVSLFVTPSPYRHPPSHHFPYTVSRLLVLATVLYQVVSSVVKK